jgi:ribosomal protein S18 acetylase RimI-like enzyme
MIEPPHPTDTPAIEQLARCSGVFTPEEIRVVREMLDGFFSPEPRDDHAFVVYRNGNANAIAGFAVFGPTPMTDRIWDLYWICVDRAQQGRGIGSILLQSIERDLQTRGARAIYLETSDSAQYDAARAFYERHAYERVAHISDFYAVGEGKVMYRKTFQNGKPGA